MKPTNREIIFFIIGIVCATGAFLVWYHHISVKDVLVMAGFNSQPVYTPLNITVTDNEEQGIPEQPVQQLKHPDNEDTGSIAGQQNGEPETTDWGEERVTSTPDVFEVPVTDDHGHDEQYWRKRYVKIQVKIETAMENKSQLLNLIKELSKPVLIQKIEVEEGVWRLNHPGEEGTFIDGSVANRPEIDKIRFRISELEHQIEFQQNELELLREECRKAGCLPGWVR